MLDPIPTSNSPICTAPTSLHVISLGKLRLASGGFSSWLCPPMQVSYSGQAVVFVVRTMSYSLFSRAGLWTYLAFFLAQVNACTLLAVCFRYPWQTQLAALRKCLTGISVHFCLHVVVLPRCPVSAVTCAVLIQYAGYLPLRHTAPVKHSPLLGSCCLHSSFHYSYDQDL